MFCCTEEVPGSSFVASCPICLPAALHAAAAHTGTVGRRQNRSDAEAQVWWDGELSAAGTTHAALESRFLEPFLEWL